MLLCGCPSVVYCPLHLKWSCMTAGGAGTTGGGVSCFAKGGLLALPLAAAWTYSCACIVQPWDCAVDWLCLMPFIQLCVFMQLQPFQLDSLPSAVSSSPMHNPMASRLAQTTFNSMDEGVQCQQLCLQAGLGLLACCFLLSVVPGQSSPHTVLQRHVHVLSHGPCFARFMPICMHAPC